MPRMSKVGKTATRTTETDDTIVVAYHNTNVVQVDKRRGKITLDHGGWMTYTTKTRMNQAAHEYGLGFSVYQTDGAWFVRFSDERRPDVPFSSQSITFKR